MEEGGNWLPVRNRPDGEPTMSDHDARALLIEALDFFNDHPRFSLRRDRRRTSYELAARIDAFLAPATAVLPIVAAGRERWNKAQVLRIDQDEQNGKRDGDGYWVRARSTEERREVKACVSTGRSRWTSDKTKKKNK